MKLFDSFSDRCSVQDKTPQFKVKGEDIIILNSP